MNHNMSADIRNQGTTPTMKNRVTKLLSTGLAVCAVFTGMPDADAEAFLPDQLRILSTVPPNGDLNPYGVAFVPLGFQSGTGPLRPGQVLVSNFNNSANLQGTGTTIVRVSLAGPPFCFLCRTASPKWINWSWAFDSTGNTAEGLCDRWKRAFNRWHIQNGHAGLAPSDQQSWPSSRHD